MPWSDEPGHGVSSHTAWRIVILIVALAVAGAWVLLPILFENNASNIAETNELSCRLGALFIGQPIEKQPQQTEAQFERVVQKAIGLLRSLKSADCSGVQGASITTQQIQHEIHALQVARGGGHSSGSPPGSSPGGGGHGQPPSPPNPGPPPGTTTTTTTPAPPPTTTTGAVERICHVTRLGARICHLVHVG